MRVDYYHRETDDGDLLVDIELTIPVANALHEEWWTGMSEFSRLRLGVPST